MMTTTSLAITLVGLSALLASIPILASGDPSPAAEDEAPAAGSIEVVGYSPSFSFEEAMQDALDQATKAQGPPRLPDYATVIEVKSIVGRKGGNIRQGLLIKAVTAADSRSNEECAPNVDARCATDSDCAQCARVFPIVGFRPVLVSTTVQCIGSVCKKTGCPTKPCPQGTTCEGCIANLLCRCEPASPGG